ncbi:MerR family transcriptional regulator [Bacillus glycinifermentans]|uniref:MerR family transcriptional regulator n=1 Tax=Bacillus glycinifermentans TaxID=1664069 RepID=UPI001FF4EF23|nr:MerR family transcriptional regulator [Bacillus glycinifermentans]UOY87701.1 MerR family transcriptional regulator [Bacillus glycinifermentans]
MEKDQYYTIGVFSEKTGTSIRTLHYYDEIGLLRPEKHPSSGHRLYTDQDEMTLHKITCFKFLGYRLEQIARLMSDSSFDISLIETLHNQKKELEGKKEHIETALKAVNRMIGLLEEEKEIDGAIFMSLINSIQTEKDQREWLEQNMPEGAADRLFNKPEEVMASLDKSFIQLAKQVKRLAGKPVDDPEVQEMADRHMKMSLQFVGEDVLAAFGSVDTAETEKFVNQIPSPYTKEEEEWLERVFEYYMLHNEKYPFRQ